MFSFNLEQNSQNIFLSEKYFTFQTSLYGSNSFLFSIILDNVSFNFSHSSGSQLYLSVILIHISLMINDIVHILYTSCYLYVLLGEVCIQLISPFFNGTVYLFIIPFICCLYFLDKVLYYIYILKIITLSLCLLFFSSFC